MLGEFCVRIAAAINRKYKIANHKQASNIKQDKMIKQENKYDLEERTFKFAKDVRDLIKEVKKTTSNIEDCKQLARASASVGANYIEANEALSKKDFQMRIKISRKESRESRFFLRLLDIDDQKLDQLRNALADEAEELRRIFSSILNNSKESKTTRFDI